jgi:hypothetical protein
MKLVVESDRESYTARAKNKYRRSGLSPGSDSKHRWRGKSAWRAPVNILKGEGNNAYRGIHRLHKFILPL